MQKGLQQSLKEFQQKRDSKETLEKVNQVEEELMIAGKEAYDDNLPCSACQGEVTLMKHQ